MSSTFRGHGKIDLFTNVSLALQPILWLGILRKCLLVDLFPLEIISSIMFIMMYPHPTYLFFEVKHLIQKDGVADNPDLIAYLVFGGLSLLGLILQVATIILTLRFFGLVQNVYLLVVLFSFLAAIGGCLGLTDLVTFIGFWPPLAIKHLKIIAKSPSLLLVCFGTTILLSFFTILFL